MAYLCSVPGLIACQDACFSDASLGPWTPPSAFSTLREMERPDVVIGANATYDAGWLLTTNPRDFFKAFPLLEVLTPQAFLAQYAPAPRPHDR